MKMNRRNFVKYGIGVGAALVIGSRIPGFQINEALAAVQTLNITITDALKNMVTHNTINPAQCYFWIYKMSADGTDIPAEVPGPNIFTTQGDTVSISIKNDLDEPHAFSIPGIFDSGPIAPGKTLVTSFTALKSGAFLYYDNLNAPVNRVMGLHGAFIVMPREPVLGHKFTPYDNPTPGVQQLFDDFGSSAHYPGLAWQEGDLDPDSFAPPFRQYIWLLHQASPNLFAEVGNYTPGENYPAAQFMQKFLRDPFDAVKPTTNAIPQYFTINGQSGHFSHNKPFICPNLRAGEPCVIHVLNAGLWTHSMHLHANHFYVTSKNGVVSNNPIWIDVYNIEPMDMVDYTVPYMRPPDVGNVRGIGMPDTPLTSLKGKPVWPPWEEIGMFMPKLGTLADPLNPDSVEISVQLSPLCYPMHDHSEPSQTSQGGNYNLGMISGMNFTGDRNVLDALGGPTTFPNAPNVFGPEKTGPAAGPE
ncbi:multicopper oxidase domain-containing protein [Candidatus Methanoperedens nitratireducens]|uniref:Putative signal peptide protein n=1 Tax=Candidatus Methanoperedens nitratireducens TaxID=1392998 RepID=A0A284VPZ3_9EURY|nr:multicopper oxidase domain-containing protein [Candidatus Methanoperedens nitroreducens]SNQ61288.1 putative signal peptide protein [Candidatus Methanoperedens nitroreducens]